MAESFIAHEMREASRGSFPLSPGVMSGHYQTAHLYWSYRGEVLTAQSKLDIFGSETPDPPIMQLPEGHQSYQLDGLNKTVWNYFLDTAYVKRPNVNPQTEIRSLLTTNLHSDVVHFADRLAGKRSQIVTGRGPTPSLMRAFLYEDAFPERNNEFFAWLFSQMRTEVSQAAEIGFKESWSKDLGTLIAKWEQHFPGVSFIGV